MDFDRVAAAPVRGMEDEAATGLHRAALVNFAVRRNSGIDAQFFQDLVKAHPFAHPADADSQSAVLVMHAQYAHAVVEARIEHPRHRQQQSPGKIMFFGHTANVGPSQGTASGLHYSRPG